MAVISDSKTATQMRDEVLTELHRQHDHARKAALARTGRQGITRLELAFREGFAAALGVQIDFWENVWVEGKQAIGAKGI